LITHASGSHNTTGRISFGVHSTMQGVVITEDRVRVPVGKFCQVELKISKKANEE
jgi:hypothetical protein